MSEETIFVTALEKPTPAERATYLEAACAGDSELQRRVEALLRAHDQSGDLLDPPVPGSGPTTHHDVAPAAGQPPTRPIAEGPGSRIGPYKLLRPIGEGGMGVVFLAEQETPVRRKVALKVIKPGMDTALVVARFEAERQALALMDHNSIAKVLDAGTTDSGRPFFVMELVSGVPITEYCDQGRLTAKERLDLFVPVCQAIQHAHQKGIIHRDIKPSNVLVTLHDGKPLPKVIDFGVAKAIDQRLTERTLFTQVGVIVGTPEYMSPEQTHMNGWDVDTRSDIYSLGVLLYELLTGSTPLERQRLREAAFTEVLRRIREEDPPKPSTRLLTTEETASIAARRGTEPGKLAKLVRGELDWIVMKALEKDRGRRYETANGLARDIEHYLHDEPVEASPPSTAYRFRKFLRRHRGPVLAASIIVLLLAGGIVGTTVGLVQAEAARRSEAERARNERQAKETAERRLDQIEKGIAILGSIFEDLDPEAEEKEGRPLRAILGDRLDRAAADLDGEAVGDPLVVAKLQDRLGRTHLGLGRAAQAESLFAKASATRKARLGADHPLTLASLHSLALAFDSAGRSNEAIALLERVRDTQAKRLGGEHPATLNTERDLALMYSMGRRPDEAIALLERVRNVRVASLGGDHDLTLAAFESLADAYVGAGRGNEAIELLEKVRDFRAKTLGPDHPVALRSLGSLAFAYQSIGQMKRSIALFEQARDAVVPKFGADHPLTLNVLDNLARMYRAFGRTDEAIAVAEQVRDARVKLLGAYHPHTIHTLDNLAQAYDKAGKPKQALPLWQQAAAGLEKLEFTHEQAGQIVGHLCRCLERLGQLDQSMLWRRKWLDAERKKARPKSAAYAKEMVRVGDYLIVGEHYADAEPILREGLAILQKERPGDWETSHAHTLLGAALFGQKKYAEAEPWLIQGYEGLKAREAQIPQLLAGYLVVGACEEVCELYESWGRPEKAAAWRSKLKELGTGHPVPAHHKSKR